MINEKWCTAPEEKQFRGPEDNFISCILLLRFKVFCLHILRSHSSAPLLLIACHFFNVRRVIDTLRCVTVQHATRTTSVWLQSYLVDMAMDFGLGYDHSPLWVRSKQIEQQPQQIKIGSVFDCRFPLALNSFLANFDLKYQMWNGQWLVDSGQEYKNG